MNFMVETLTIAGSCLAIAAVKQLFQKARGTARLIPGLLLTVGPGGGIIMWFPLNATG